MTGIALGVAAVASGDSSDLTTIFSRTFDTRNSTLWPLTNSMQSDSMPSPKMTPSSPISEINVTGVFSSITPKFIAVPVETDGKGSRTNQARRGSIGRGSRTFSPR